MNRAERGDFNLEEKEYNNIYAIPANYTDSGKLFGGLLEVRNAVETGVLVVLMGYPELVVIPMPFKIRIVVMTLTLLPISVLSMMGIDGDSLFQYVAHMLKFLLNRRKLHFRRVGYHYEQDNIKKQKGKSKQTGKSKHTGRSKQKSRSKQKGTAKARDRKH